MAVETLLGRLDGVRQTGPGRWLALCPAHHDRSPSLSIRDVESRVLVHCFAGCAVADVVAVVGLDLGDLFPPRESVNYDSRRRLQVKPIPARDILLALGGEITFVMVCAADLAKGMALSAGDCERLWLAHSRFRAALHAGGIR